MDHTANKESPLACFLRACLALIGMAVITCILIICWAVTIIPRAICRGIKLCQTRLKSA